MTTETPQTTNEAAGGASYVERVVRRHKALSKKSLAAVWEWAEANEGNPLAEAYMGACSAIGMLDCSAICDVLEKDWRGKKYGYIDEAYRPYNLAFIYRDTVGRLILDMLHRQTPNACGEPGLTD